MKRVIFFGEEYVGTWDVPEPCHRFLRTVYIDWSYNLRRRLGPEDFRTRLDRLLRRLPDDQATDDYSSIWWIHGCPHRFAREFGLEWGMDEIRPRTVKPAEPRGKR